MQRVGIKLLRALATDVAGDIGVDWTVVRKPSGYVLEQETDGGGLMIVSEGSTAGEMQAFLVGAHVALATKKKGDNR